MELWLHIPSNELWYGRFPDIEAPQGYKCFVRYAYSDTLWPNRIIKSINKVKDTELDFWCNCNGMPPNTTYNKN